MKQYLKAAVVLLVLILGSLFLPARLMQWQDEKLLEKTEISEAQQVSLTAQTSTTLGEKLEMIQSNANTLGLENGRNYNQETIRDCIYKEITRLEELGILEEAEYQNVETSVLFFVDPQDAGKSAVIWSGYAFSEYSYLSFLLDDETGKILGFNQEISEEGLNGETNIAWEKDPEALAGKWAEYLGCTLAEVLTDAGERYASDILYEADMQNLSAEEKEAFFREVENLMKKGYTEAEAYRELMEVWGITGRNVFYDGGEVREREITEREIIVALRDESGECHYTIGTYDNGKNLMISPG